MQCKLMRNSIEKFAYSNSALIEFHINKKLSENASLNLKNKFILSTIKKLL